MGLRFAEQYPDDGGGGAVTPVFESHDQAALHIAQYWQGEAPDDLLQSIQGRGNPELYKQAIRFALEATAGNEAAHSVVRAADTFLWADYEAGSGVIKLVERLRRSE